MGLEEPNWREKRKLKGQCLDCVNQAVSGKSKCDVCAKKASLRASEAVKIRRKSNLNKCHVCGVFCFERVCGSCKNKQSKYRKALRIRYKEQGLCADCGQYTKLENLLCCEICYMKTQCSSNLGSSMHWKLISDKFYAQEGRCYFTDRVLIFGINASLDHLYPRKRFPDLASEISNLVWCDKTVNEAKKSMTEQEFIDLCTVISSKFTKTRRDTSNESVESSAIVEAVKQKPAKSAKTERRKESNVL